MWDSNPLTERRMNAGSCMKVMIEEDKLGSDGEKTTKYKDRTKQPQRKQAASLKKNTHSQSHDADGEDDSDTDDEDFEGDADSGSKSSSDSGVDLDNMELTNVEVSMFIPLENVC